MPFLGEAAKTLEIYNFVHADIRFAQDSEVGANAMVDGVKRGMIRLTDQDDFITIGISSNSSGWRNDCVVRSRDGDDNIWFRQAINDYSFSNKANDSSGKWTATHINAGAGNDVVDTSSVQTTDTIRAKDGDDTVRSGGGDDHVRGGLGQDYLDGGYGNDNIRGQHGDDIIIGGDGNDTLRGGQGNDILIGDSDLHENYQAQTVSFSQSGNIENAISTLEANGIHVRARNIIKDSNEARLTDLTTENVGFAKGGIGAHGEAATRPSIDEETGYDPVTGLSELFEIDFDYTVNSASVTLHYFYDETHRADFRKDEVLTYRAYFNGVLVLEGTVHADDIEDELQISGSLFDRIELEGLPYNNQSDNAGISNDSSDFLITSISYTRDDSASGDDIMRGGKGDDNFMGGQGNDSIDGAQGDDIAHYRGNADEYVVTHLGGSRYEIKHIVDGVEGIDGTDTLRKVEFANFADELITLSDTDSNAAPDGNDDTVEDLLVEDGPTNTVARNVISGDINNKEEGKDFDADGDPLTVSAIRSVDGSIQSVSTSGATEVVGNYGTLSIQADGSYTYTLHPSDNGDDNFAIQRLAEGQVDTDEFIYAVSDGQSTDDNVSLLFDITGTNENYEHVVNPSEDEAFSFTLNPEALFKDIDEGDNLTLQLESITSIDLSNYSGWLQFDSDSNTFTGQRPSDFYGELEVTVKALDDSGAEVSTAFNLRFEEPPNDDPSDTILGGNDDYDSDVEFNNGDDLLGFDPDPGLDPALDLDLSETATDAGFIV